MQCYCTYSRVNRTVQIPREPFNSRYTLYSCLSWGLICPFLSNFAATYPTRCKIGDDSENRVSMQMFDHNNNNNKTIDHKNAQVTRHERYRETRVVLSSHDLHFSTEKAYLGKIGAHPHIYFTKATATDATNHTKSFGDQGSNQIRIRHVFYLFLRRRRFCRFA